MKHAASRVGVSVVVAVVLFGITSSAHAGSLRFEDGRWRVEATAAKTFDDGGTDRNGDYYGTLSAEYEVPTDGRLTLGLRVMPLFLYSEHKPSQTVYGAGVGLAIRFYQYKKKAGWFVEGSSTVLLQTDELEGNSSQLNFLSGGGVGYKFQTNPWHVATRFEHLSNSNLGSRNSGINGIVTAVGYTF